MSNLQKFNQFISRGPVQQHLVTVLGERKGSFVSNLTSLVANDKALQQCEPITLMYAAICATSLDLPLDKNLGYAYVIPYKDNKRGISEAQFQLGYKGLVQLAIRSNLYTRINVSDVREGELSERNRLTGDIGFNWITDDAERLKQPVVGYVAYFRLKNGYSKTLYMSVEEVTQHATRYSQTFRSSNEYVRKSSKWSTDFDAMAMKTVLKLLISKHGPTSVEMQTALAADQSVQRQQGEYTYVDNQQDETNQRLSELAAANAAATARDDSMQELAEDTDFETQDTDAEPAPEGDDTPKSDKLPFE